VKNRTEKVKEKGKRKSDLINFNARLLEEIGNLRKIKLRENWKNRVEETKEELNVEVLA
jgi:hypothetical protein